MRNRLTQSSVKEAFDNLPRGCAFFTRKGIPVLCNKAMQEFVHTVSGKDIQTEDDIQSLLADLPEDSAVRRDGGAYLLSDGTVWKIYRYEIGTEHDYTEYVVENITELYRRRQELGESNALRSKMVSNMKHIVDNVVDITREEEILTMKMQVHGKVGWFLQRLRGYHAAGCPADQKAAVVATLRELTGSLYRNVGNEEETDAWAELLRVSKPLGVTIQVEGELPKAPEVRKILTMAVRECVSNTVRHAEGNLVKVVIETTTETIKIRITNNGKQPQGTIIEGGGFGSLRKNLERSGCQMEIVSSPTFALEVTVSS